VTDAEALIVQLSDPHVGADWGGRDPAAALAEAVAAVTALERAPAAVLVTGDLAGNGLDSEYERVRELLAPLGAPLYVLPGNHDDRAGLRRAFGLPGTGDEPVLYTARAGALRIVVFDTTRPGHASGGLDAERLAWLDGTLADEPGAPTLIALHHPPLWSGMPAIDELALPDDDRAALAEVVSGHPQVRLIAAGHVHRPIAAQAGGRAVLTAPSTYLQLRLDLRSDEFSLGDEPPGYVLHALRDGGIASHVVMLDRTR
jgi:3',5'-cyclic-AMP phosphodiesterase